MIKTIPAGRRFLIFLGPWLLLSAAAAEFRPFSQQAVEVPPIDFCGSGRFLVYTGSCSPGGRQKDVISRKACADVASALEAGLPLLYPNAPVTVYDNLTPDGVMQSLTGQRVQGFFFVGEGDTKGAFLTGPARERLYPDISACVSGYDLFGGFTSHSKYSPALPAPKADRALILSRTQTIFSGADAVAESWPGLCKPRVSLVYPTRTFAGRMKDDVKKLLTLLQGEKRKHVLKTLAVICDNCPGHVASRDELAQFCSPYSNVCSLRKLTPGNEDFVLKNYCLALAPAPSRE